jgi:hypothetical protein
MGLNGEVQFFDASACNLADKKCNNPKGVTSYCCIRQLLPCACSSPFSHGSPAICDGEGDLVGAF